MSRLTKVSLKRFVINDHDYTSIYSSFLGIPVYDVILRGYPPPLDKVGLPHTLTFSPINNEITHNMNQVGVKRIGTMYPCTIPVLHMTYIGREPIGL